MRSTHLASWVLCSSLTLVVNAQVGVDPAGPPPSERPWWDDYPRIVEHNDPELVAGLNADVSMNGGFPNASWGAFAQRAVGLRQRRIDEAHALGLRSISWFEAFGASTTFVAQLRKDPLPNWDHREVVRVYWNWPEMVPGPALTIQWLGVHDFFDDAWYARPFTRTHATFGVPGFTYADGTPAVGYRGLQNDPRNHRVYDAGGSKNLWGELVWEAGWDERIHRIRDDGRLQGPLDGLVYEPKFKKYVGLFRIGKDNACPHWRDEAWAASRHGSKYAIDGAWVDNWSSWDAWSAWPILAGFGDWSVSRFRDYLARNFTAQELGAMGVLDPATFDVRDHLRSVAVSWAGVGADSVFWHPVWLDRRWLDEPVWRAYKVFKRQIGEEALSEYYRALHAAAAAQRREFAVLGNDVPVFSLGQTRGDLDLVSCEISSTWNLIAGSRGIMLPPEGGRYGPVYHLAREHARSRFVTILFHDRDPHGRLKNPGISRLIDYEMLTSHALPLVWPDDERMMGPASVHSDFFGFVGRAKRHFANRVPQAKIGILYSSSSILHELTPMGMVDFDRQTAQFGYLGWATALECLHKQYRAIPEWKLTPEVLSTLRVLVIPSCEVLDQDVVTNVVEPWVAAGGLLVVTGSLSGRRRDERHHFEMHPGGASLRRLLAGTLFGNGRVSYEWQSLGVQYYLDERARESLLPQFRALLDRVLRTEKLVISDDHSVPSSVVLKAYADRGAERLFVDVLNTDLDLEYDKPNPAPAMWFELELPEFMRDRMLTATALSPDVPPAVAVSPASPGRIKVEIGSSIDTYASVWIQASPR